MVIKKVMEMNKNFVQRFYIYQKERFPLLLHGVLIAVFSFSAISYSRLCRGVDTFIQAKDYLHCIFITITLFFLVRVFDEFKDKEDDAKYRSYLPVPRGLISLKELAFVGAVTFALQIIALLLFHRTLFFTYIPVIIYLLLMGKEFFIADWLKKRQFWYVTSHMFIIPFIDIYASSYDWKLELAIPPTGLLFFFVVSYMNGIVLELGRKMKTSDKEEVGVVSYTGLLGPKKAAYFWLLMLLITYIAALLAWQYTNGNTLMYFILTALFFICTIPAFLFSKNNNNLKLAKGIEICSGIWTIGMYLCLGGGPMALKFIFQ
jgi:4-hydroxybenzoate polyprenyltransferase